jgi:hypothetical protein
MRFIAPTGGVLIAVLTFLLIPPDLSLGILEKLVVALALGVVVGVVLFGIVEKFVE